MEWGERLTWDLVAGPALSVSSGVRALDWIPVLMSPWVVQTLGLSFPI